MSGTTTNYDANIFTGERSEFGMPVFSDPRRQATYEYHETGYKKKYMLKQAYDKQEFLRKMHADIKREYLTRKKQVKRLQRDAAVDFRNAEMSLQEHYASASAQGQEPWRIHGVDICAPLTSQIQLPRGEILDLKTLHCDTEFAKVRGIHEDLRLDQEEQEQEQRRFEEQEQEQSRWWEANADALAKWEQRSYEQRRPYAPRAAFGGCYDEEHYPDEHASGNDNGNGNGNDSSSYDSDYCAEFGYYPREYNCEREWREAEEAAAAAAEAAEQQRWEENTRDSDDEGLWDEEAIADEAEHIREIAQMKLDGDHPDVQQLEHIQVTEPKERITASTGGINSAQKKAAKARIAKQQQKKHAKNQQQKFVPIQVTINTNRVSVEDAEAVSAMLYRGKVQVNLPKKNMQAAIASVSASASREDKKRHDKKWRRINAAQKQSNARGTRIENIPEQRAWHNCGGSDNEWDVDY